MLTPPQRPAILSATPSSRVCASYHHEDRGIPQCGLPDRCIGLLAPNGPGEADGGWRAGICLGAQAPQLTSKR